MLTQEKVVTIKVLKQQGKSIKRIARETGLARNTIKKYLQRTDTKPVYQRKTHRPSKLEPFKDYIQSRIDAAHPDWIPASVLYEEILALGYQGKRRILSGYLATLKPKALPEPLVRFETKPGKQLQVDFTIIRRGKQALKAFVATLGYSRASYVHFYDNERTDVWVDGLVRSFEFFGGVPHEILFDNAKAIILERDAYRVGEHRWNPKLLSLAQDYGFNLTVCRPYRAKTKGKVERFNRYLKSSFVVPLQATLRMSELQLDVQTANGYVGYWLTQVANARVHGTTGEIPNQRLITEQNALLPLPIKFGNIDSYQKIKMTPMPFESLQHPLSVYDQLLQGTL
ncbi:UNVERIFIED_ORG: transposase [Providencia alcalifaciens]